VKLRDLERHLRSHGCVKEREGGRHTIWSHPSVAGTAAVPRHSEIKSVVVRDIGAKLSVPSPLR
jgi:predicted RNA binding protein YcfA (HicA-like mRNA interferase family)